MNTNNLTIEEQKLLTEWLGECWHDWERKYPYPARTEEELKLRGHVCAKCGTYWPVQPERDGLIVPLDFSDWRVVGRLVEKVGRLECLDKNSAGMWFCKITYNQKYSGVSTPQLAICRAVLTYLKEGEK